MLIQMWLPLNGARIRFKVYRPSHQVPPAVVRQTRSISYFIGRGFGFAFGSNAFPWRYSAMCAILCWCSGTQQSKMPKTIPYRPSAITYADSSPCHLSYSDKFGELSNDGCASVCDHLTWCLKFQHCLIIASSNIVGPCLSNTRGTIRAWICL